MTKKILLLLLISLASVGHAASLTEDFNAFVGTADLDSNTHPQPWPAVNVAESSLQHDAGQVRLRPNAVVRNRHPTPLDTTDHCASIEYTAFNGTAEVEFGGPSVRMNATTATFYNASTDGTLLGVEKYVTGSYDATFAGSFTNYVPVALSPGDRVEVCISGSSPVQMWVNINGNLVTDLGTSGIITDSVSPITAGDYVGLFGFSETATQTFRMDNFAAEDDDGGGGSVISIQTLHSISKGIGSHRSQQLGGILEGH